MFKIFPFLNLAWRQSLTSLILVAIASAPIAWLGKSKAAAYGALAGSTVVSGLFVSWVSIGEPRPELNYTLLNATLDLIYIATFALACHLWWLSAVKKARHAG